MSEPMVRRTRSGKIAWPVLQALALCSLLVAAAPLVQAAAADTATFSVPSTRAVSSLLLDVAHAGKRLVAVGERGHVLYSDDDGANWTQAKVPTRQMLTAVYFVDEQHGWAVGHDALILASSDGGATWSKQFEDLQREAPLLDLWFRDAQHGFAIGAYGALLETSDGGASWDDVSDRLDNEDTYHLNAIAEVPDAGLFIVGEMGSLFRSTDEGQSWETLEGPYQGSLFGVIASGEPNGLLVFGLRGHLFRSTDAGETWQQVPLATASGGTLEFGLASAAALVDGSILVVGHGGSVLRSTDHGHSFSVFNRPDRVSLAGVTAGADGKLVLVGQGGVRLTTETGANPGQQ
ncbi:WD40/YVTN/BNR-like repeat-containing protein [Pseudomonas argentinensis]|uniref:WD40/YVTN/BNR-like repeat-containing protein n=1 Tax=Phytopseudomonas argentinensis TaxID=289370 RepID=UPI0008A9E600|nr:YCF48-related protein [Pseudomonas argentinensis]